MNLPTGQFRAKLWKTKGIIQRQYVFLGSFFRVGEIGTKFQCKMQKPKKKLSYRQHHLLFATSDCVLLKTRNPQRKINPICFVGFCFVVVN